MPSDSNTRKFKSDISKVFRAVEDSPKLLDLLEIATSPARQTIFIEALLETKSTAFTFFGNISDKAPGELFTVFTSAFGNYPNSKTAYEGISAAIDRRHKFMSKLRNNKRNFIKDIGLNWTPEDKKSFISKVNSFYDVVRKSSFIL